MLTELGIKRIQIPLPFRLNHVNCFFAEGDHGYTIIDTGLHMAETRKIWEQALGNQPVEKLILTHLHPDHCGYAGVLQKQTAATVHMTATDAAGLKEIWSPDSVAAFEEDLNKAGTPAAIISGIKKAREKMIQRVTPLPHVNHFLEDGDEIMVGTVPFDVITVPGHAAGLICLHQKEHDLLLSTDHILPKITPNIAYWFYGEANPLQSYEASLKKIKQLHIGHVVPSHGEPFHDANKRIDEIWAHHEERLAVTMAAVKNGAITAFAVCKELFERELTVHEYQFAIGETIAHLEYLRNQGEICRELENGLWKYAINSCV